LHTYKISEIESISSNLDVFQTWLTYSRCGQIKPVFNTSVGDSQDLNADKTAVN